MKKFTIIFIFLLFSLLTAACGKVSSPNQAVDDTPISEIDTESPSEPQPPKNEGNVAEDSSLPIGPKEIPYPDADPSVSYSHPDDYDSLFLLQSGYLGRKRIADCCFGGEERNTCTGASAEFLVGNSYSIRCADDDWSCFDSRVAYFGDYCYTLSGSDLIILSVVEESEKLNSLTVTDDTDEGWYGNETPSALGIENGFLYVLTEKYLSRTSPDSADDYEDMNFLSLKRYSLDNPESPLMSEVISLEGIPVGCTCRDDGILMTVFLPCSVPITDDVSSYVPSYSINGESYFLTPGEIDIPSEAFSSGYTIMAFLPFSDDTPVVSRAVAGCYHNGILSGGSLYLAGSGSILRESDPYSEGCYTVTACSSTESTQLLRYDLDSLTLSGNASASGRLSSSSSFDLVDQHPILGLTEESRNYRRFEDENYHFENFLGDGSTISASLLRYDEGLLTVEAVDAGNAESIQISADSAWIFSPEDGFFPGHYIPLCDDSLESHLCESSEFLPIKVLRASSSGLVCSSISYLPEGDYYDYSLSMLDSGCLHPKSQITGVIPDMVVFAEGADAVLLRVDGSSSAYSFSGDSFEYLGDVAISYLDRDSTVFFRTESGWCLCNDSAFYSFDEGLTIISTIPLAFG